jgi:hypothetical protein
LLALQLKSTAIEITITIRVLVAKVIAIPIPILSSESIATKNFVAILPKESIGINI